MKKLLVSVAVLGLIASSLSLSSYAVVQGNSQKGFISVNTSANTEIAPDVVEVSFAVLTSDAKSMQKATLANKEISDKLYSDLGSMLNSINGDYIKTSDYSANPIYSYSGSKKNFDRYEVSNRVFIHTKSIDKIGQIIDKAISLGATNVDSLSFSVSKYDDECNQLLGIATQKAKTRADILAKNLATTVDGIRSLDVSCSANNYNNPRMYMAKNMLASVADEAAGVPSTAISAGVVKINANVNASFFVK